MAGTFLRETKCSGGQEGEGGRGGSFAAVIDCRFLLYLSATALLEEELAARGEDEGREEKKKKLGEKKKKKPFHI